MIDKGVMVTLPSQLNYLLMLCLNCSKDFTPKQIFCTSKCRTYYHRKNKVFSNGNVTLKNPIKVYSHKPGEIEKIATGLVENNPKMFGNVTVTKDTINPKVAVNPKMKLDKKGLCPHYILGGNNCRSCNG